MTGINSRDSERPMHDTSLVSAQVSFRKPSGAVVSIQPTSVLDTLMATLSERSKQRLEAIERELNPGGSHTVQTKLAKPAATPERSLPSRNQKGVSNSSNATGLNTTGEEHFKKATSDLEAALEDARKPRRLFEFRRPPENTPSMVHTSVSEDSVEEHLSAFDYLINDLNERVSLSHSHALDSEVKDMIFSVIRLDSRLSTRFNVWEKGKHPNLHMALHGVLAYVFAHLWEKEQEIEDVKNNGGSLMRFTKKRGDVSYTPSIQEVGSDLVAMRALLLHELSGLFADVNRFGFNRELFLRELQDSHASIRGEDHSLKVMDIRRLFLEWVKEIFSRAFTRKE